MTEIQDADNKMQTVIDLLAEIRDLGREQMKHADRLFEANKAFIIDQHEKAMAGHKKANDKALAEQREAYEKGMKDIQATAKLVGQMDQQQQQQQQRPPSIT